MGLFPLAPCYCTIASRCMSGGLSLISRQLVLLTLRHDSPENRAEKGVLS